MTSISRDRRTRRRPMDNISELVQMWGQVTGGRGTCVTRDGLTRTVISLQLLDSPVELPLLMPGSGSSPPMKSGAISNANIFLCGRRAPISGTFFVIPRSHLYLSSPVKRWAGMWSSDREGTLDKNDVTPSTSTASFALGARA